MFSSDGSKTTNVDFKLKKAPQLRLNLTAAKFRPSSPEPAAADGPKTETEQLVVYKTSVCFCQEQTDVL